MKRILTLVWLTAILVCCDVGPRHSSAGTKVNGLVDRTVKIVDGIIYHIYCTGSSYTGVFVVNHTKELLEIELIKKQINEIDKGNQE